MKTRKTGSRRETVMKRRKLNVPLFIVIFLLLVYFNPCKPSLKSLNDDTDVVKLEGK